MPEYVAGLQFETVLLIHVNAVEVPLDAGDGIRPRFISSIYLGSSRAEQTLKISEATTHGGKSDIRNLALARCNFKEVAPPREPKKALSHGMPGVDDRRIVAVIIDVIKQGLMWRDTPKDHGPQNPIYNLVIHWSLMGVFDSSLPSLLLGLPSLTGL